MHSLKPAGSGLFLARFLEERVGFLRAKYRYRTEGGWWTGIFSRVPAQLVRVCLDSMAMISETGVVTKPYISMVLVSAVHVN